MSDPSRPDTRQLHRLDASYIDPALEKAAHYRLLNWPEEAESICLDVLEVSAEHQKALELMVLSLADQFLEQGNAPRVKQALRYAARVRDEYERTYLIGIIHEREGRAHLIRGFDASFAYECFADALDWFAKAETLAPTGNQEAALRYNSCVRTMKREKLEPRAPEPELPLE